jgi:hypothetical protein
MLRHGEAHLHRTASAGVPAWEFIDRIKFTPGCLATARGMKETKPFVAFVLRVFGPFVAS